MLNPETTTEQDPLIARPGPSENQKPDSALVAQEHYHGVEPAPDNLVVSPGPLENQEADATTNPSRNSTAFDPLVLSTGPSNNQEFDDARPAPESHVLRPGPPENQEPDAAAKPAPDLAHDSLITGPPENQEFDFPPQKDLLIPPRLNFDSAQHDSSRSPTPRLKMRGSRPKRRNSGEKGEKARLIEKDRRIEILEDEVSE
jgi:hypothetical protein